MEEHLLRNPNTKDFFKIKPNFSKSLENKGFNPVTTAGTLGYELGPGGFDKYLNCNMVAKPRMTYPGNQLATGLYLNQRCNMMHKPESKFKRIGSATGGCAPNKSGFGTKKTKYGNVPAKKCPKGKKLNPKTGKCVLKK